MPDGQAGLTGAQEQALLESRVAVMTMHRPSNVDEREVLGLGSEVRDLGSAVWGQRFEREVLRLDFRPL